MDLLSATASLATLTFLLLVFAISVRSAPNGVLSLPAITMLTALMYFFLMPLLGITGDDTGFFGWFLDDLGPMHLVVLMYLAGATAAFIANRRLLLRNPAVRLPDDGPFQGMTFVVLWALAVAAVALLFAVGFVSFDQEDVYRFRSDVPSGYLFLNQGYNLAVPLTLVTLLRDRFKWKSLVVLFVVVVFFLQAGSRFRILILLVAAASAYAITHRHRIGVLTGSIGAILATVLLNIIGAVRTYGRGLDLSNIENTDLTSLSLAFRGELGVVYAFSNATNNPLPPPLYFEPWLIALSRLVPTALWPDKPTATTFSYVVASAHDENVKFAGVMPPQQMEMLFQFGRVGVPLLAFLYFALAAVILRSVWKRGAEARVAAFSLIPIFFGYYMQSRGYFSQIFTDALFMFGPLFLLHARQESSRGPVKQQRSPARKQMGPQKTRS